MQVHQLEVQVTSRPAQAFANAFVAIDQGIRRDKSRLDSSSSDNLSALAQLLLGVLG